MEAIVLNPRAQKEVRDTLCGELGHEENIAAS
jgi:hypothetical protein